MNYLVTSKYFEPFFTNWFDIENHYAAGMIVYNLLNGKYYDGIEWRDTKQDHL